MCAKRFTLPFFFTLIGFIDSLVLLYLHYRYVSITGYSSFCTVSEFVNCDTIQTSVYSHISGITISLLAFVYYIFLMWLLWPKSQPDQLYAERSSVLYLLSLVTFMYSIFLAAISLFKIHALCIPCAILYFVNLSLFLWAFLQAPSKTLSRHIIDFFHAGVTAIKKYPITIGLLSIALVGLLFFYRLTIQKMTERSLAAIPKEVTELPFDISKDPV